MTIYTQTFQAIAAALLALPAVATAADSSRATVADTTVSRRTEYVVVISLDGLRPDAIAKFGATTLKRLMREGSYALDAQTILPSKTLPSHTSMLTGVAPASHGVTWNSQQMEDRGYVKVPTVFGIVKAAGLRTAAFFSKTKFEHVAVPASLDYSRAPRGGFMNGSFTAERTTEFVEEYLESAAEAPNLLFVHIGEADYAGHMYGWMGRTYGRAVRAADRAVAEVLDEANDRFGAGNYTVIVTADHGGNGRDHGSDDPRDTTIPWIIWGKGVQQGVLPPGIRTMDTAATALWLLGVQAPSAWSGVPVRSAFSRPRLEAN